MNGVKKVQILDGTTLKIIAMISMVFDHVGDLFFPGVMWPRMIDRLAMPIFSFFIAEGFAHIILGICSCWPRSGTSCGYEIQAVTKQDLEADL